MSLHVVNTMYQAYGEAQAAVDVPLFDTTAIHAEAASRYALQE